MFTLTTATACSDDHRVHTVKKANPGKDIRLFGGGKLFCSLAEAGMVDTVEVSVVPILLGDGVPVAPNLSKWINLSLVNHKVYSSGAVSLEYAVRSIDPS